MYKRKTMVPPEDPHSSGVGESMFLRRLSSTDEVKIALRDLNSHFVCVLCFGYFVDATTITECMHTFCRSCIVNFLQSNHHCPHCDTLLSRTRPFNSLRCDRVMQSLVYKIVPGLFQTEMRRRLQFYQNNPNEDVDMEMDDAQNYIYGPDDSISLSISYYNIKNIPKEKLAEISPKFLPERSKVPIRYFRCPATVPVYVLKSLIKTKYRVSELLKVELLYGEERLLDSWTLMEVAYIFRWSRDSPMELTFQVLAYRKVRRKKLKLVRKVKQYSTTSKEVPVKPNMENKSDITEEPPLKIPRTEIDTRTTFSPPTDDGHHHHRPPTPPETPEGNTEEDHQTFPNKPIIFKLVKPDADEDREQLEPASQKINEEVKIQLESDGEDVHIDVESTEFPENDSETSRIECDSHIDAEDIPISMDEDGEISRIEDDSGDYGGDPDSETPLEVDTSHETEPEMEIAEPEKETKTLFKSQNDNNKEQDNNEFEENEKQESENQEEKKCNTDTRNLKDFDLSKKEITIDKTKEEAKFNKSHQKNESSDKTNAKHKDEDRDVSGALDFSSHARSVRAKRETTDSSENNTPSPDPDLGKGSPLPLPFNFPITTNSQLQSGQLNNGFNIQPTTFTTASPIIPRPQLPMPPLMTNPVVPPAFRDLMTLSQAAAAAQLQLAVVHAQAQAQAQVHAQAQAQAQAQNLQAQVQANMLKNLKATETLSFVNGSGDTLTISPIIPGNQGKSKSKNAVKPTKLTKMQNHNQIMHKTSTNNNSHNQPKLVIKPPTSTSMNGQKSLKVTNIPSTKLGKDTTLPNGSSYKNIQVTTSNKQPLPGNLKTAIPKSSLPTSLKIPNIQVNNTKSHVSKNEKEKKDQDKDKNRTGDPVFKITNQKIIEYVRKQHLNNKLKQTSNSKSLNGTDQNTSNKVSTTPSLIMGTTNNNNSKTTTNSEPTITSCSNSKTINSNALPKAAISTNKTNSNTSPKTNLTTVSKSSSNLLSSASSLTTITSPTSSTTSSPVAKVNSYGLDKPLLNGKTSQPPTTTPKSIGLSSTTLSSSGIQTVRTTNTNVRHIPNPSRLLQQSQHRISGGIGRSGFNSSGEGLSRIESLTRSLHEKVAASARVSSGVVNSLAR